ncbi:MAG: hypothetical protein KME30_29485 [Iphinoe sp. HA4291-MV1]|nr:hypothetical protein [Iphinoe sp. HA4291-MV1]
MVIRAVYLTIVSQILEIYAYYTMKCGKWVRCCAQRIEGDTSDAGKFFVSASSLVLSYSSFHLFRPQRVRSSLRRQIPLSGNVGAVLARLCAYSARTAPPNA